MTDLNCTSFPGRHLYFPSVGIETSEQILKVRLYCSESVFIQKDVPRYFFPPIGSKRTFYHGLIIRRAGEGLQKQLMSRATLSFP